MEVIWRPEALQELSDIIDYRFEVAGKQSAVQLNDKITTAASRLASQPEMGPKELSLEELPHTYRHVVVDELYKIIYRIDADAIHIFSIWDCRQDPESLKTKTTRRK